MKYLGIGLVYVWRYTVGAFLPQGQCKYHPSCSQYAIDALRKHGLVDRRGEGGLAAAALQSLEPRRSRLRMIVASPITPLENLLAVDPRLLPQQRRAAVGLVDRRADDPRPDLPRAARRPADPLDAEPAGARAADEGDPAEVQGRPREDERGVDEVLQGEQHQPGLVVPAARWRSSRSSSRSSTSCGTSRRRPTSRQQSRRPVVARRRPERSPDTVLDHWSGYLLLFIYAASQIASTYFMSATMDKTQRWIMMVLPIVFIPLIANFPTGLVLYWMTTNLWTVGQGLVTRRLAPKPVPAAEDGTSQRRRANRRRRTTAAGRREARLRLRPPKPQASRRRSCARKKKRARR